MSSKVRGKVIAGGRRSQAAASDHEGWVWTLIFASAGLTALFVAALFTIVAG
jgi:hypothetical protein